MALRNIREIGDPVLEKTAKPVKEANEKIKMLIGDMLDTMYEANGVGLAAPQVGILKRLVVIDVSPEGDSPIILINPELIETSGEQTGYEGCLSVPGKSGVVTRPNYAKAKAFNENMEEITVEGEGLLARAICHELDHLDGHLYVEKVEGDLVDNSELMDDEGEEKIMKVIFMGTPDFAVPTLRAIHEAGHELLAVVTQPDKPKGRGNQVQFPPVKEQALAYGVPVYQPKRVREEAFIEVLRELAPDVIVVVAFGQILPKAVLELPKYGCINVHASLLPKLRGAAPIQWSIINGEEKTGVTTMFMDVGLDTGDMLLKAETPISPEETGGSLHDRLSELGGPLLIRTLSELEAGTLVRIPQKDEESNYAKMLDKALGSLDFTRPAAELERLIRGLNPWPSAYTHYNGKTLKIWKASVLPEISGGEPGTIVEVKKDAIIVAAGKGALAIEELQLEGKKRMSTEAFLRGYEMKVGTLLQ